MSRSYPPLPPELHEFLEWESTIPPLPHSVRTRAVARARAALAARRAVLSAASHPIPRSRLTVVLTSAAAMTAAAGGVGYALRGWYERAASRSTAITHVVVPAREPHMASAASVVPPYPAATASGSASRPSAPEPEPDELLLLGEVRSAVANGEFALALALINEHARRFESSALAEEREALHVRALSGLGRTKEARRAADAFEARFPNSVLVRAVRRMVASKP
jgi:hypothetical protein